MQIHLQKLPTSNRLLLNMITYETLSPRHGLIGYYKIGELRICEVSSLIMWHVAQKTSGQIGPAGHFHTYRD